MTSAKLAKCLETNPIEFAHTAKRLLEAYATLIWVDGKGCVLEDSIMEAPVRSIETKKTSIPGVLLGVWVPISLTLDLLRLAMGP